MEPWACLTVVLGLFLSDRTSSVLHSSTRPVSPELNDGAYLKADRPHFGGASVHHIQSGVMWTEPYSLCMPHGPAANT